MNYKKGFAKLFKFVENHLLRQRKNWVALHRKEPQHFDVIQGIEGLLDGQLRKSFHASALLQPNHIANQREILGRLRSIYKKGGLKWSSARLKSRIRERQYE
jgi:hypothetical protein